jgi:hypothetical protein
MIHTFNTQKIRSTANLQDALDALSNSIEEVGKELTYLDLYNIVDSIDAKDDFYVKTNLLVNNSAVVINTPNFILDNIVYKTGDIVLKTAKGKLVHIKAQAGGLYYPSQIQPVGNSGEYNLIFRYASNTTEEEVDGEGNSNNQPVEVGDSIAQPFKTITFTGVGVDNTDTTVYGEEFTIDSEYTFKINKKDNETIVPLIKLFMTSDGEREEVITEFVLEVKDGDDK